MEIVPAKQIIRKYIYKVSGCFFFGDICWNIPASLLNKTEQIITFSFHFSAKT